MRHRLAAKTVAALLTVALVIGGIFALMLTTVSDQNNAAKLATRADSRVAAAVSAQKLVLDAETGLRGYQLTGKPSFLQPYSRALAALPAETEQLENLSAGDGGSDAVGRIVAGIDAYFADYANPFLQRAEPHPGGPIPVSSSARRLVVTQGKQRMDALRSEFTAYSATQLSEAREQGDAARARADRSTFVAAGGLAVSVLIALLLALYQLRAVARPLRRAAAAAQRLARGDLTARLGTGPRGEVGELIESFNQMAASLERSRDELESQNAELEAQQAELESAVEQLAVQKAQIERYHSFGSLLSTLAELEPLAEAILRELGDLAGVELGAVYVADGTGAYVRLAARGHGPERGRLLPGEGLAGRAIGERRAILGAWSTEVSLGEQAVMRHELHLPMIHGHDVLGVVSLARPSRAIERGEREMLEHLASRAAAAVAAGITLRAARRQARINQAVVDTAADGFVSIDATGRIREWNRRSEHIFGRSADEVIGRPVGKTILPSPVAERWRERVAAFVETGEWPIEGERELMAIDSTGREFPIEVTVAPLELDGGWVFNAFVRDISERKRAEHYLVAQHRVASALAESGELDDARARALEALVTSLDFEIGIMYGLDESSQTLRASTVWPRDKRAAEIDQIAISPGEGLTGRCWESGRTEWASDITEVAANPAMARAAGVCGAVCLPVTAGHEFIGVIQLISRERVEPDRELSDMLAAIGPQVGGFVARKRAEQEAERLKDEFFALVSHELRTPLTSIIGYLELVLEDAAIDAETRGFLEVVDRNAQRLLRLVGDLLFVAQVEAGKLALDVGTADLGQIAAEAVEGARPRALEQGIELMLDADRLPVASGDAGRLAQALDNLVSNALKFTAEGGRVEVSLRRRGDLALIDVRDDGIGIPATEQSRLFERFFRAAGATELAIPGVGLGLTIVKAIVEGHHGRVDVDSEEGRGTTFRVTLPLRQPAYRIEPLDAERDEVTA